LVSFLASLDFIRVVARFRPWACSLHIRAKATEYRAPHKGGVVEMRWVIHPMIADE
jgi:hypothetical protein